MARPLLQIALDNTSLKDALESIRLLGSEVDVIEAGTILLVAEGLEAVRCIRALHPEKIVSADVKAADAGGTLAKMCIGNGANWMTVICCAPVATMIAAMDEAKKTGADIQIELFGDWTFEQAAEWKNAGIVQVVYHRGRDEIASGSGWGQEDLDKIKKLVDMGFKVSVTGGLGIEEVKLFKGIDVFCFIAGRSLRDAKDPKQAARDFIAECEKYWE